jgi:polyisoprenoid-binding protein YceI
MMRTTVLVPAVLVAALPLGLLAALPPAPMAAQQPNPFGGGRAETTKVQSPPAEDSLPSASAPAAIPAGLEGVDSAVYRLSRASRLDVKTGKAGLFGFAGHSHVIRARAFDGQVVFHPKNPASSRLEITVRTNSLVVLTPPDTAEIRKVTAAMRSEVLHVDQYPEIRLVSRKVTRTATGFRVLGALTLVGQTRTIPVEVSVRFGLDTLRATTVFSVKQTLFGIKPYSGGPAGTVKVADRVTFNIDAIAVRAHPATTTGR